ncbi:MAG: Clp protease N-terminal domain-containing protein, partial [Flavobacteriaceae bacterium]|nr:Clp protease N-terminal domain-containing protein [Flavobacteriaceae bacterium]
MNFNKFTIKSQEAIQQAQVIAQTNEHPQIENEHLIKALIESDPEISKFLFQKIGVDLNKIKSVIDASI